MAFTVWGITSKGEWATTVYILSSFTATVIILGVPFFILTLISFLLRAVLTLPFATHQSLCLLGGECQPPTFFRASRSKANVEYYQALKNLRFVLIWTEVDLKYTNEQFMQRASGQKYLSI